MFNFTTNLLFFMNLLSYSLILLQIYIFLFHLSFFFLNLFHMKSPNNSQYLKCRKKKFNSINSQYSKKNKGLKSKIWKG